MKNTPASPAFTDPASEVSTPIFDKCITCKDLGRSCCGPNMLTMDIFELRNWVKKRKRHLGLSIQDLAELANTPKSTMERFLSNEDLDFKYTTAHTICRTLIGQLSDHPCPASSADLEAAATKTAELIAERDAKIDTLQHQLEHSAAHYAVSHAEARRDLESQIQMLNSVLKTKDEELSFLLRRSRMRIALLYLFIILSFVLLAIVTAYIVWDIAHPGAGFIRY